MPQRNAFVLPEGKFSVLVADPPHINSEAVQRLAVHGRWLSLSGGPGPAKSADLILLTGSVLEEDVRKILRVCIIFLRLVFCMFFAAYGSVAFRPWIYPGVCEVGGYVMRSISIKVNSDRRKAVP